MQLTGKQIVEEKIITRVCEPGIQQQGVDVRVKRIGIVLPGDIGSQSSPLGMVPAEGKTITPKTEWFADLDKTGWQQVYLKPAYYELEFIEGCMIPDDCVMHFKTRSSLVRCGAEVRSGQFDAGFTTEHMGAYMKVEVPMVIELGARVAQALVSRTAKVENTYNGQWQGDKQRKS